MGAEDPFLPSSMPYTVPMIARLKTLEQAIGKSSIPAGGPLNVGLCFYAQLLWWERCKIVRVPTKRQKGVIMGESVLSAKLLDHFRIPQDHTPVQIGRLFLSVDGAKTEPSLITLTRVRENGNRLQVDTDFCSVVVLDETPAAVTATVVGLARVILKMRFGEEPSFLVSRAGPAVLLVPVGLWLES